MDDLRHRRYGYRYPFPVHRCKTGKRLSNHGAALYDHRDRGGWKTGLPSTIGAAGLHAGDCILYAASPNVRKTAHVGDLSGGRGDYVPLGLPGARDYDPHDYRAPRNLVRADGYGFARLCRHPGSRANRS